jgi:hypothetical protein
MALPVPTVLAIIPFVPHCIYIMYYELCLPVGGTRGTSMDGDTKSASQVGARGATAPTRRVIRGGPMRVPFAGS